MLGAGAKLNIANVRNTTRKHDLTSKLPQKVSINRVSKEAIWGWQRRLGRPEI